jgi:hypothetical protein
MLKAGAGFILGYWVGNRHGTETVQRREGRSASGWLSAFLILIALLAWGHLDLRPHARPAAHSVAVYNPVSR